MKKLMFAAAFAATTVAFGSVQKDAQVYQLRIAARTTQAVVAEKAVTTNENPFATGNYALYRDTTQYVLNGLIWGCGCDAIKGTYKPQTNLGTTAAPTNVYNGAMVWMPKTMKYVFGTDQGGLGTDLGWCFLNAIGKAGNKCEGAFQIWPAGGCADNPNTNGSLMFAGFGTLGRVKADRNTESNSNCTYYVSNISGNFAGYLPAPTYDWEIGECTYCEDTTDSGCVEAPAWDWCKCAEPIGYTPRATAAYGEWYIRYNAAMSAALREKKHIGQVYDFGGRSDKNDVWVNYVKRYVK